MDFMKKAGEGMAKKPLIPLAVLIIITAASLGMIMMNPPSFNMDEGGFSPDNELINASNKISDSFTTSASVMTFVDAGNAGGDVFTKDTFTAVLKYERSLYEMTYTGTDGTVYDYASLAGFGTLSPISSIAGGIYAIFADPAIPMIVPAGPLVPPDPADIGVPGGYADYSEYMVAYYDFLIDVVNDPAVSVYTLKFLAGLVLENAPMLGSLFTNDLDTVSVSAKGCMVMVSVNNDEVNSILNGMAGFESDISAKTTAFMSGTDNVSGLKVRTVGMQSMMEDIGRMAQEDISMLLPIAIIVIIVLLLLIYRSAGDTFVGLLGLLLAVAWTFGITALLNISVSTIGIAVPILIMALGIDYGLHMVFRYREERRSGKGTMESTGNTMGSVGKALVLATVTTVIAFMSYQTSSLQALADFGLMCAIGIGCAFASMMLLIPTFQAMRDRRVENKGKNPDEMKRYRKSKNDNGDIISRISGIGGRMAAKRPLVVIGVMVIIVAGFGVSATNISYNFDLYDFVPEGTEAHEVLTYMGDNYSSMQETTSVLIYASGWDVDTIRDIESSLTNMASDPINGLTYSVAGGPPDSDYIGTALYDLNFGNPQKQIPPIAGMPLGPGVTFGDLYGTVFGPDGRLIAVPSQTNLNIIRAVIESDDKLAAAVSSVVSNNGEDITRIILHMSSDSDTGDDGALAMMDKINAACAPMGDRGTRFITTGSAIAMAATMKEMNDSQMTSLIITIAMVLVILTIVLYYTDKSPWLGIMATIPTITAVVMVWGTMALINMPLNVMTLTIASLAVGLGVTYGIHITHRYASEIINGREACEAVIIATRETGKGVFAAAITTIAGFGVMVFSKILPMYQFGVITALAIGFGYIGAVFLLPSMLVIWGKRAGPRMMDKRNGVKSKKIKDPDFDRYRIS
jgi:predicted RND superfamily exporter protein